jgi:hypothetical protein
MIPGVTVSRYWNRSRAVFSSVVRSSTRLSSSLGGCLAPVDHSHGLPDKVFGLIAQQLLGALVDQYDLTFLVGGDDGVCRAFDQAGKVSFCLKSSLLSVFAVGNVGPGANELQRTAGIVIDNPECVEDPNVTALSAAEAVFQGPFAAFYETWTFVENSPGVFRMEVVGPTLGIGCHLLRRIAHDRLEILADIGAGKITGSLGRVDDRGADSEQMLWPLAGAL